MIQKIFWKIIQKKKFDSFDYKCNDGDKESDKICQNCSDNIGEKYKCSLCKEGYFLPFDVEFPLKCKKCFIKDCISCNNYTHCNNCTNGFILSEDNTKCINKSQIELNETDKFSSTLSDNKKLLI